MENKKYNVTEIFHSVQGEGFNAGTPAVFVRFAHCNLNCHFCDTDFRQNFRLTAEGIKYAITETANGNMPYLIVLTGGEPMLQLDKELLTTIKSIDNNLITIAVETNGTIVPVQEVFDLLDWVTVSPKDTWESDTWKLKAGDELKLVYDNQDLTKYFHSTDFDNYFLQPMDLEGIQNLGETLRSVKAHPEWRLSMQQQKIWNVQ